MSRRASLPGAEELFRRTGGERRREHGAEPGPRGQDSTSTNLQIAQPGAGATGKKAPKHDEKVTIYCTREDLLALEAARLRLRGEFGVAADRGRIVRAALAYVLEDFEARGEDGVLVRRLVDGA